MTHYSTSAAVSPRNKFSSGFKFLAILLLVLLVSGKSWGQTNPTAFDLSTGSFSFTTQTATLTTYPTNMQGWTTGTNNVAVLPTAAPGADQAFVASGTASTSGLSNLGANGFNFLSTGSSPNQQVGEIAVALNASGRSNLLVTWTAADQNASANSRIMNLTLQYRLGTTGTFTTVASSTYTTTGTATAANPQTFTNIPLPGACDNQAIVQIRWVYYESASQTGSRHAIRLDDITVSSSATSCSDPTTQASSVTFSNILSDQMTVNWVRGGTPGDGVIVVAKAGSAPDDPVDNTSYNANAAFGTGTQIGTGTYVVFNGSGTSVNVTGLSASTTYYFKAYEKNCTGTSTMINTTSPAANNQATTAACSVNPTVTSTVTVNTIAPTTASSGGTGLSSGANCLITAKGVCWNTSTAPTISNSKTTDGTGTTDYTSSLTGLSAQTLYYVRAYATNGFGTAYGPEVTFRTLSTELAAHPGTFTATSVSSSQINLSFSAASTITNAKGYIILRRTGGGGNPSTTGIVDGVAPGSLSLPSGTTFITDINSTSTTTYNNTGLPNPITQYNYAIIAYNWDGVNPETYNYYTSGTIKTANATTLTQEKTLPYTQDFESTTSEWSLAASGTNLWAIGSATNNGGSKALYISNNAGTSNVYSTGTTQSATDAAVRVDLTGQTTASLSFDWKCNGESSYDYGEVYVNTGGSDILISAAQEFVSTTTFASKRISLTPYVGGIATIKFRWVNDYSGGSQPPFAVDNISITAGDVPIVATTAVSSTTVNGTSSGGNVTNDGGSTVTARGVCYGTSSGPTIAGSKTSDGSGTGAFTSTLNGLTDNTLYYVRAYATNSTGTAYGNEVTFTTSSVSAPITTAATSVSSSGFTANWGTVTGASGGYLLDVSTYSSFVTSSPATLSEGFETGMPGTYSTGTYSLGSGSWSLINGGKSTTSSNNHSASAGGCQLQGG
ncbi:MAG: hypothetical protein WCG08_15450, partial [Paludibacter sp.]